MTKKQIKEMQKHISFNVNNGGCIHFAYFFSNALTKLNVEHSIIFTNSWEELTEPKACTHVGVYIKNIGVIDSKDIDSYAKFISNQSYLKENPDEINFNKIRNSRDWNKSYNRYKNASLNFIIKKYIK